MNVMQFGEGEPEAGELVLENEVELEDLEIGRKEALGLKVIEFYNMCHGKGGLFCEGADGPGRLRDNNARAEKTVGKHAPQWMKNLLSRRISGAKKAGAATLPKGAAQYQKELVARRMEQSVLHPTEATGSKRASAAPAPTPKKAAAAPAASASKERKKEKSGLHPAGDYAYVPEGDQSSGWKLRLTSKPGGKPDRKTTAAAAQALSPAGFRGRPVQIPAADRAAVVARVREAWLKARPEMTAADLPESLKG